MTGKVVVLDSGYESYCYEKKIFADAGYRFEIFSGERHDRAGKMDMAKDAVGLLIRHTEIDEEFLQAVPQVKAITRYGVGYDNLDLAAATRHNVKVANVQGYANHSVSDHVIALMYACTRGLLQGHNSLRQNFGKPPVKQVMEFHDKKLGIIGLGRIGGTLCQKVLPLFERVLASDPYISDERFASLGAEKTELEELLAESDVISIHCNLTDETRELINADRMRLMQKKPILINTARGSIVNLDNLYDALQSSTIHSAGLDVFDEEPPLSNRDGLLEHPNVIATGHYAWYSTNATVALQERASNNLLAMLQGRIPEDCLNSVDLLESE